MLSDSPPERDVEWTDSGVEGAWRLVGRVWETVSSAPGILNTVDLTAAAPDADKELRQAVHGAIAGITEDIEQFRFNKAIARVYEFLNALKKAGNGAGDYARAEALSSLARLIAPFTPHLAEECWETLGGEGLICNAPWPKADTSLLTRDTIILPVQINGKKRDELEVAAEADKDTVEKAALSLEGVQRHIGGKTIRKVVVVPGRIVNIVAN